MKPAKLIVCWVVVLVSACAKQAHYAPVVQRTLPNAAGQNPVTDIPEQSIEVKQVKSGRKITRFSQYYAVEKGDTLFTIAWRFDLSLQDIASWNGIQAPYVIYAGQKLRLKKPAVLPAGVTQVAQKDNRVELVKKTEVATEQIVKQEKRSATKLQDSWIWPTEGKVIQSFDSMAAKKGLDIAGVEGQPVIAAAAGEVVFSNNNLRGYGNLVIIKHSDELLSAYAYNKTLVVTEGDRVQQGQQIATMGKSGNAAVLHFELRRQGKPIDPIRYLGKR